MVIAIAAGALATTANAQYYINDFDTATGTGGYALAHPGGGFFQLDGEYDDGIVDEFVFAGSNAGIWANAFGLPTGGVGGTGAGHLDIPMIDPGNAPPGQGPFFFAGIGLNTGPLGIPGNVGANSFSIQVLADLGQAYTVSIESAFTSQNNGWAFGGVGDGTWQTISGAINSGSVLGSFNPNESSISLIVTFADFNNAANNIQQNLKVDNASMIPAPASLALLGGLGLFGRRRR